MRSKILSVAMSAVLAFSLVSTTALTAFADQLGASSFGVQATGNSLVYDSVYGVFGGEYALMYKDVAYEYADSNGQKSARVGQVVDLVRADGQVMVHTSNVPESSAIQPGGYTDLQLSNMGRYSDDINQGFVKVQSKATRKSGLKNLSGSDLVPCSYDSIVRLSGGYSGVAYGETQARADFFASDGSSQGSVPLQINLRSDGEFAYRSATYRSYGDYVGICVTEEYRVPSSDGSSTSSEKESRFFVVAKRSGGQYTKDSEVLALYATQNGNAIIGKSDGNIYYRAAGKADVLVASASGVEDARFYNNKGFWISFSESNQGKRYAISSDGNVYESQARSDEGYLVNKPDGNLYFVANNGADVRIRPSADIWHSRLEGQFIDLQLTSNEHEYYNVAGTRLAGIDSSAQLQNAIDGFGLFYVDTGESHYIGSGHYATDYDYQIYDASGVARNRLKVQGTRRCSVDAFESESPNSEISKFYWKVVTEETAEDVGDNGEEESSYVYRLRICNPDGSLKSYIGEVASLWVSLHNVYNPGLAGYEISAEDSASGKSIYCDLDFNVVSERPTRSDSGTSVRTPTWTLPDGTGVYRLYGGTGGNVGDANGNPITIGGYTLGVCTEGSPYSAYNTVKHGGSDVWWAKDASGKWGAISSTGAVKVPFMYDAYYDGGMDDTDYALVRKDFMWSFVNVQSGVPSSTTAPPTSFADAKVTAPAQTYTGASLTPVVTVTLAGQVLPSSAYDVSCPEAINAGSYLITVTGKGQYSGIATGVFKIQGAPIPKSALSGIVSKTYTGKALKQSKLVVKVGGKKLKANTDYTVKYRNNKKAGKATVTVTGKGNYAGKASKKFTIAKAKLSKVKVAKVKPQTLKAAGKAVMPKLKVTYKGKKLKAGRDYKAVYKNCKQVGTARAVLKGRGNFKGKITVQYEIR